MCLISSFCLGKYVWTLEAGCYTCYCTCVNYGGVSNAKKLTVTMDEEVYDGSRTVVGPRKISRFIEDLVRPYVIKKFMYAAYEEMAADQIRESEALEWAEGTIGDLSDEAG